MTFIVFLWNGGTVPKRPRLLLKNVHRHKSVGHNYSERVRARTGKKRFVSFHINHQQLAIWHSWKLFIIRHQKLRDGRPGFDFRQGQEIFLFSTVFRPALGPTQLPIRWLPGTLSQEVKRPGNEADHFFPSSAEVKNDGAIPPLPHTFSWSV
jgi:hypothetical protein